MKTRRVVVTGMGAVTPLAGNLKATWDRLINGHSGIGATQGFEVADLTCKIAGHVPEKTESFPDGFDGEEWMPKKDQRKTDRFVLLGMGAASQALADAGIPEAIAAGKCDRFRTGVVIGSGIGGLPSIEENSILVHEQGARRLSPFFIPSSLINLVSGQVSIRHGLAGPNHSVVTACASGAHAIGDAGEMIKRGDADVMVAGGAESAICRIGIAGFCALRALSTSYNDQPTVASRPWDKGRDGFVMGEGAGLMVLEEYEHALARGAHIYAELVGYGMSGDAYHITAPESTGDGAFRAMKAALARANLEPSQIGYVNAHGTSTPMGDEIELAALKRCFGSAINGVSVSSTKSSIGHLLGAAGGVEALFVVKAMNEGILPPTLNLRDPSPGCEDVDLVPLEAKVKRVTAVMSNSFGFGGTNATVIFKEIS